MRARSYLSDRLSCQCKIAIGPAHSVVFLRKMDGYIIKNPLWKFSIPQIIDVLNLCSDAAQNPLEVKLCLSAPHFYIFGQDRNLWNKKWLLIHLKKNKHSTHLPFSDIKWKSKSWSQFQMIIIGWNHWMRWSHQSSWTK